MVNMEEILLNLKDSASAHLYLKTQDESLFRNYLKYCYYLKGAIDFDTKQTHTQSTSYKGTLIMDNTKNIFYYNGGLSADSSLNVSVSIGTLTLP